MKDLINKKLYFSTWSTQNNAIKIALEKLDNHYIYSKQNKIFDFSSLSFQTSFGLQNSQIKRAIIKQSNNFLVSSPKFDFKLKDQVTINLLELLKLKGKIFYTLSGAEGIENAIKISKYITGRKIIACRQRSYHGATQGALACTGDWRNKEFLNLNSSNKDIFRIPEPNEDPEALQAINNMIKFGPSKISALCIETVTGANGVIIANSKWWKKIQIFCKENGIHLILDEVVCGFNRTHKNFAFHHYSFLKPDFVVMSKAITGGFVPFGAVFVSTELSSFFDEKILPCGLTNYAHPLGLAATNQVLKIVKTKKFLTNLDVLNQTFTELIQYEKKTNNNILKIRHIGFMLAMEINKTISTEYFLQKGFYLYAKKNIIILMPHLNLSSKLLEKQFSKLITTINNY